MRLGSRSTESAQQAIDEVRAEAPDAQISPVAPMDEAGMEKLLEGASAVIASGPPGVQLLGAEVWKGFSDLKVAIDLNAVPPLGIGGVEVTDKRKEQAGTICYGAIGVGGTKMKIHRAAIAQLFTRN